MSIAKSSTIVTSTPSFSNSSAVCSIWTLTTDVMLDFDQFYAVFSLSILGCIAMFWFLPKECRIFMPLIRPAVGLIKNSLYAGVSQFINEGWQWILSSSIKIVGSFTEVGIFGVADKIARFFSLVALSIFTVLLPTNIKKNNKTEHNELLVTLFLALFILVGSFIMIIFAEPIMTVLFGTKFAASIGILKLMIEASALMAIQMFVENHFFVNQDTKTLMQINLTKLGIFLALFIVFAPSLGLYGLVMAYLLASLAALSLIIIKIK